MTSPQVGDERQLTPKEHVHRQAQRMTIARMAYSFRIGKVTKEQVEAEEDAFYALALAFAAEDMLQGVAV